MSVDRHYSHSCIIEKIEPEDFILKYHRTNGTNCKPIVRLVNDYQDKYNKNKAVAISPSTAICLWNLFCRNHSRVFI